MQCPWCDGTNTEQDTIDIGVGDVPCGPMGCNDCHAYVPTDEQAQIIDPKLLREGWYREPDELSATIEQYRQAQAALAARSDNQSNAPATGSGSHG